MKNTIINKTTIALLAACAVIAPKAMSITIYTSAKTGNWNGTGVWTSVQTGSANPKLYIIQAAHTVTVSEDAEHIDSIFVFGTLQMGNNRELEIRTGGKIILENSTSMLKGGSANSRISFAGAGYQISGPFTSGNIITNGPRYATAVTTNDASGDPQGSFVTLSVPLPVELSSYDIEIDNANHIAQWTALGESNRNDFILEISQNGRDYSLLTAIHGAGETVAHDYSFSFPAKRNSYYLRLSEKSQDGIISQLAVKYVKVASVETEDIHVFPTLIDKNSTNNINIVLPEVGNYTSTVYNSNMQMVHKTNISAETNSEVKTISVENLSTGIYFITIQAENGSTLSKKILITQ